MVRTGFSEVMGSWKIMAMRLPRMLRMEDSLMARRSWPSNITLPAMMRPGGLATRRMMESAPTLFPQPLSPTMARVSPSRTS